MKARQIVFSCFFLCAMAAAITGFLLRLQWLFITGACLLAVPVGCSILLYLAALINRVRVERASPTVWFCAQDKCFHASKACPAIGNAPVRAVPHAAAVAQGIVPCPACHQPENQTQSEESTPHV